MILRPTALLLAAMVGGQAPAGEPVAFGVDDPAKAAVAGEATTAQLASFLYESLFTEVQITVPDELRRRAGDLSAMAVDLDPVKRVHGAFGLALIGRGEVLTRTAFEPVVGSPPFEKANAAFLACAVRQECAASVKLLRQMGAVAQKKSRTKQLANVEAVMQLSLIKQEGFAAYVGSLKAKTRDPGQLAALEVALQRHARTFPGTR